MALKLETIQDFYGFAGDSKASGQYYFSQNMTRCREGIKPFWEVEEYGSWNQGVPASNQMSLLNWMDESAGNVYGIDTNGWLWSGAGAAFSSFHLVGQTNIGNGLVIAQNGSIFYCSNQYLGFTDGTDGGSVDTWIDLGYDANGLRPMERYESYVVITTGSCHTVGLYNTVNHASDSIAWADQAFTLPLGFAINSIQSGSNGLLIGANLNDRGVLILWDALADRSIAPWIWLDSKVKSIIKDGNGGWIVSSGNELFYTNGYSKSLITNIPDNTIQDVIFGPNKPAGMVKKDWYVFIGGGISDYNRKKKGIWVLDLRTKLWEFISIANNDIVNLNFGAFFIDTSFRINISYASLNPYKIYQGVLKNDIASKSYLITNPIGRGNNYKVAKGLLLDITWDMYQQLNDTPDWTIEAGIYDYSRQFWNYAVTNDTSSISTAIHVNGALSSINTALVGDMVMILEGTNAGQIAFISSIDNQDSATETWNLDRALTGMTEGGGIIINVFPIKKIGTAWNITSQTLTQKYWPIEQTPRAKKFMIFLYFSGASQKQLPALNTLSILYNDLGYL